jgi:hypothetical protein
MVCDVCKRESEGLLSCPECGTELASPQAPPDSPPDTPPAEPPAEPPPGEPPPEPPLAAAAPEPQPEPKPEPKPQAAAPKPPDPPPAGSAAAAPPPPQPPSEPLATDEQGSDNPMIQVKSSEIRDLVSIRGHGNIYASISPALKSSLFDFLTDLPELRNGGRPDAELEEEAREHAAAFGEDPFLLLSCGDPSLALSAACALIEALGVSKQQQKLLNAERVPADVAFDIYQLTTRRVDREADAVILLDAMNDRGQIFIDSLFSIHGALSTLDIASSLRQHGLSVICLVQPQKLGSRASELPLRRWDVSRVKSLLRRHFPNTYRQLDATITEQRRRGCWSSDERELGKQVESLLDAKQLEDVVRQGGPSPASAESDAIGENDPPLRLAVLYVATFYPNLAPNEFSRVLTTLVGEQRTVVPETVRQKTKDGSFKEVQLHREKPLAEIWRDRSDALLRECQLITSKDGNRVVTFQEAGRRDRLRRHYEENYGIYVQDQFLSAWEKALLFDPSNEIAKDLTALAVDMATTYPNQFGHDWLFDTIEHSVDGAADPKRVLGRIVPLLRAVLREPKLNDVVPKLLDRLLHAGRHENALDLVKNLRCTELDEFEWLKQVIDRSSAAVRANAARYVEIELYRRGGVYSLLGALETWLPAADRDRGNYSPSNDVALHIVFRYLLGTSEGLDTAHDGLWPSRLPLLAVDGESATDNFASLFRFLFHPAMAAVIAHEVPGEDPSSVLFALIAEWVFVLLAPAKNDGQRAGFSADHALSAFVEQLVRATSGAGHVELCNAMLAYWERMKVAFALGLKTLGQEGVRRRHEFAWKRALMTRLLTHFRHLQRELRPALKQRVVYA